MSTPAQSVGQSGAATDIKYSVQVYSHFEELYSDKMYTKSEMASILNVPVSVVSQWMTQKMK